jgi:UDP-2,3-diacylglucosamine pyrophosphatase LpxH
MTKEIFVFSDVEMGGGTVTDDFASDGVLCELINNIGQSKNEVDLIFNGDTFDFLKCPIVRKRFTFYLEHITVNVAMEKLGYIKEAHKTVFEALKKFSENKKHTIYFIHGNHDYELLFPEIQEKMKSLIGENIFFQMNYFKDKIYLEHGHQRDVFFAYDLKKVFKEVDGKKELNIPALFSGFSAAFMDTKEWHPFMERIEDRVGLFKVFPSMRGRMVLLLFRFYLYNLLFAIHNYIIRGYISVYFKIILVSLGKFIKRSFDVEIKALMKSVKYLPKNAKIVIFGHVHEKINELQTKTNKRVIILDTWREEYSFSDNLKFLVPKTKRYLRILVDDTLNVTLYDLNPKGGKILFEKVAQDEFKYSEKVFNDRNNARLKDYEIEETNFTIN